MKTNKFKDEDHCTIRKYAAIHGTAATLRKFKKFFPHYRLTESAVRVMREKYHRIVKSPSSSSSSSSSSAAAAAAAAAIKKLTLLKTGRPLLPDSLDEKVQNVLVALRSKGVVNTIVIFAEVKALIEKGSDESLKFLDLDNSS